MIMFYYLIQLLVVIQLLVAIQILVAIQLLRDESNDDLNAAQTIITISYSLRITP